MIKYFCDLCNKITDSDHENNILFREMFGVVQTPQAHTYCKDCCSSIISHLQTLKVKDES
jgi:hypothetical protein